jgi:hypothetical protein
VRDRLRGIEKGRPKVTWTRLPKRRPYLCLNSSKWINDRDDLDRERDYRERLREHEGRGQTVRAYQHAGRKKMRTRTRIGVRVESCTCDLGGAGPRPGLEAWPLI